MAAIPKWLAPSLPVWKRFVDAWIRYDDAYRSDASEEYIAHTSKLLDEAEAAIQKERATKKRDFKAGVKLLRRFRSGFDADDGFNLREVNRIKSSRVNSALKAMRELRSLLQYPHKVIRVPKSRLGRRAVLVHTTHKIAKGQKLVPVHVQVPDKTTVRIKGGSVRVERQVKDGSVIEQFFYLPRVMYSFDEIADWFEAVELMMPDGFYTLHVAKQGQVMEPISKSLWGERLRSYWGTYDARDEERASLPFASTVVGFRYVASTLRGALVESKRFRTEAEIFRDLAKQRRKEERAKVMSRLPPRERRRIEREERQEAARKRRQQKAKYRAIRRVIREREDEE